MEQHVPSDQAKGRGRPRSAGAEGPGAVLADGIHWRRTRRTGRTSCRRQEMELVVGGYGDWEGAHGWRRSQAVGGGGIDGRLRTWRRVR